MRKTCNKEVNVYNLLGEYQVTFDSLTDCADYFNSDTQSIWAAVNNTGYHKGFILKYSKGTYEDIEPQVKFKSITAYRLYNKEGLVMEWDTMQEVAEDLGCTGELVRYSVKTGKWICKKQFRVEKKVKKVPVKKIKYIDSEFVEYETKDSGVTT